MCIALNCTIDELLNNEKYDKFAINHFQVTICTNLTNNSYDEIKYLLQESGRENVEKYLSFLIADYQNGSESTFFVIGKLKQKIIAFLKIIKHKTENKFLISNFFVKKNYRGQGYGTLLLDSTISSLNDKAASSIGIFISKENLIALKVFQKFNFSENIVIKNFCSIVPEDNNSLYYELKLKTDLLLEKINENTAKIIAHRLLFYSKIYGKNIPGLLMPNKTMWIKQLLSMNLLDNELCLAVKIEMLIVGYTYMFYEDYDNHHFVTFHAFIDNIYICQELITLIVNKVKEFFTSHKNVHKLEMIKFFVNDNNVLPNQFMLYRRVLKTNGFTTEDEITFIFR